MEALFHDFIAEIVNILQTSQESQSCIYRKPEIIIFIS